MLKSSDHPDLERIAGRLERTVEKVTEIRYSDARLVEKNLEFTQFIALEKQALVWSEAVYRALIGEGLVPNLHQAGDPRIYFILEHLDRWPLNEPFRATALAKNTGLSRSNLDRIVIKALGISSKSYMGKRRLNHALRCLRNPEIPVKQIAIETGFQHSSSFCTWFRLITGNAPGEMAGRLF